MEALEPNRFPDKPDPRFWLILIWRLFRNLNTITTTRFNDVSCVLMWYFPCKRFVVDSKNTTRNVIVFLTGTKQAHRYFQNVRKHVRKRFDLIIRQTVSLMNLIPTINNVNEHSHLFTLSSSSEKRKTQLTLYWTTQQIALLYFSFVWTFSER